MLLNMKSNSCRKNGMLKLLGFSLVELTVGMIIISVLLAAFMPIITKKTKANSTVLKGGGNVLQGGGEFGPDCLFHIRSGCILCNIKCSEGEYAETRPCTCRSCKEYSNLCTACDEKRCNRCDKGYFLENGNCTLCPKGNYCDGLNRYPCTAGTYQSNTGKSECMECNSGKWQDKTGQSSCKSCGAGTYSDAIGPKFSCTPCAAGTYNTGTGNSSCKTCDNNYYCPGGDQKISCSSNGCSDCKKTDGDCTSCPAGKYVSGGKCMPCTKEDFCTGGASAPKSCSSNTCETCNSSNGECLTCLEGMYLKGGKCAYCPAGKYCEGGKKQPIDCPLGKYSTMGSASCADCPPGQYTAKTGSTSCSSCGEGKYYLSSKEECGNCPKNCKTCTNDKNCTECYNPYILSKRTYNEPADNLCHDISKIYRANAGDSGGPTIPAGVTICTAAAGAKCNCIYPNLCCFNGDTSHAIGKAGNRVVCNWPAANAICAANNAHLPSMDEANLWGSLSTNYGSVGLDLCESPSGYGNTYCHTSDTCWFTTDTGENSNRCFPQRMWTSYSYICGQGIEAPDGLCAGYYQFESGNWSFFSTQKAMIASVRCVKN